MCKLDGLTSLVTNPPHTTCITKEHPAVCNPQFYSGEQEDQEQEEEEEEEEKEEKEEKEEEEPEVMPEKTPASSGKVFQGMRWRKQTS